MLKLAFKCWHLSHIRVVWKIRLSWRNVFLNISKMLLMEFIFLEKTPNSYKLQLLYKMLIHNNYFFEVKPFKSRFVKLGYIVICLLSFPTMKTFVFTIYSSKQNRLNKYDNFCVIIFLNKIFQHTFMAFTMLWKTRHIQPLLSIFNYL